MELRRAFFQRLGAVHDDRQLLVIDLDRLGCVLRRGGRAGYHQRDFLADMAHAIAREGWALRHLEVHAAAAGILHLRWRGLEVLQVFAGVHGGNAGHGPRGARVDPCDARVRAVGAQEGAIELAGEVPVGGIAALAFQEPRVFATSRELHQTSRATSTTRSSLRHWSSGVSLLP